jgi:hypothetical protein
MLTRMGRNTARAAAAAFTLLAAGVAQADLPKGLTAAVVCAPQKAFVLCSVPVQTTPGWRVTFAEANLLEEPKFLRAVSRKSTFTDTKSRRPNLKLGFVTTGAGTGTIVVQARAMICSETSDWCDHLHKIVSTTITVPR